MLSFALVLAHEFSSVEGQLHVFVVRLRELFILGEDYVSLVACQDEVDDAVLFALREAGAAGRQSGELSLQLDVDYRDVSRRIYRMNRRMGQEIGETIITKRGHKWKLISQLRRDFAAEKEPKEG